MKHVVWGDGKALLLGIPRAAKEDRNGCNTRAANFHAYREIPDTINKFIKGHRCGRIENSGSIDSMLTKVSSFGSSGSIHLHFTVMAILIRRMYSAILRSTYRIMYET